MLSKIRSHKGFTLIELMIVVAIIGILAAIAIPNFLRFQLKAKTSEAKNTIGNMNMLQTTFKAEYSYFLDAGPSNAYALGGGKVDFLAGGADPVPCDGWYEMGFDQTGMVYYQYQIDAVGTAAPVGFFIGKCANDLTASSGIEMVVAAVADLDGKDAKGEFAYCTEIGATGGATIGGLLTGSCLKSGEVLDLAPGEF